MSQFVNDFIGAFVGAMIVLFIMVVTITCAVVLVLWKLPGLEDAINWGLLVLRCAAALSGIFATVYSFDMLIRRQG